MTGTPSILPVALHHRAAWDRLYAGYADFYRVTQTPEMRDRVWSWLHDPAHEVNGLIAESDGVPVGLAHWRCFARPLSASTGCFLDDLFVDPAARGQRVADALILHLGAMARARGWSVVRWITADDNYRGRGVYDRVAKRTMWITYDHAP
jgi:GNAT superfamily N-acetyltransferase